MFFAIARSAYLRLRPGSAYLRLRWLVENQHSAAFACGLPLHKLVGQSRKRIQLQELQT